VPVISLFFGIVIRMFYREHGIAHFHAEYQGQQATFTFNGEILAGNLQSRTALRLQGVGLDTPCGVGSQLEASQGG
jgi:hypothetical protein